MPALPRLRWRSLPLLLCLGLLGCLSLTVDLGMRATEPDGVVCQTGRLVLPPGQTRDVYYAAPFQNIPQLALQVGWFSPAGDLCLQDQQRDHFRVFNGNLTPEAKPLTVTWTAKGLPGTLPAPPVPAAPGNPTP